MRIKDIVFTLLICCCIHQTSGQWFTPEQTDVFDLVDEAKVNFYEFLGVAQDTSQSEIRRAYRKLSLTMHPDKNKTEGAEENFRILAAMYEVLKNKEKREIYDEVLVSGLPAAYLYVPKQLRKMSMLEVSIIISLILTLGHFLVMWGSYAEKRLTLDEILPRIKKKQKKQRKKGVDVDEINQEMEELMIFKPTVYDILPILIVRKFYHLVLWIPEFIKYQRELKKLQLEEEEAQRREREAADHEYEMQVARRNEAKKMKQERNRQKKEEMIQAQKKASESGPMRPAVFENTQSIEELEAEYDQLSDEEIKKKKCNKNEWTEEEDSQLVRLMTKYPGGTPERWTRIAKEMGRTIREVTAKAKDARTGMGNPGTKTKYSAVTEPSNLLMKSHKAEANKIPDDIITTQDIKTDVLNNVQTLLSKESDEFGQEKLNFSQDYSSKLKRKQEARNIKLERAKQIPTDNAPDNENQDWKVNSPKLPPNDTWEQGQQKLLEMALAQFPKSSAERWDKITKCVPGKTKEECIARYRFLAEKIQQRKKSKT